MTKRLSYQNILDSIYFQVEEQAWPEITTESIKDSFQLLLSQWEFDKILKLSPWQDWERDLNTKLAKNCKTTILEVCKKVLCNTMKLEGIGSFNKTTTTEDAQEFIKRILCPSYSLDDVIIMYALYQEREIYTSRDFRFKSREYIDFYKDDTEWKLWWIASLEAPVIAAMWIENLKNMTNQCIEAVSPQYSWKARFSFQVAKKVKKIWAENLANMNLEEIEFYMWIGIGIYSQFAFEQIKKHGIEKIRIIDNLSQEKKDFTTTDKLFSMTIEELGNYSKASMPMIKEVWLAWISNIAPTQLGSWKLSATAWVL